MIKIIECVSQWVCVAVSKDGKRGELQQDLARYNQAP